MHAESCCEETYKLRCIIKKHQAECLPQHLFYSKLDIPYFFEEITAEVFHSGFNFGRLLSVFCLVMHEVDKLLQTGQHNKAKGLVKKLEYLLLELEEQIHLHNGWAGFFKFFEDDKDHNNTLKYGLLFGGLGIAALFLLGHKHQFYLYQA